LSDLSINKHISDVYNKIHQHNASSLEALNRSAFADVNTFWWLSLFAAISAAHF